MTDKKKDSEGTDQDKSEETAMVRIPVMWAADYGDVGQSRSEATLVVFLH